MPGASAQNSHSSFTLRHALHSFPTLIPYTHSLRHDERAQPVIWPILATASDTGRNAHAAAAQTVTAKTIYPQTIDTATEHKRNRNGAHRTAREQVSERNLPCLQQNTKNSKNKRSGLHRRCRGLAPVIPVATADLKLPA